MAIWPFLDTSMASKTGSDRREIHVRLSGRPEIFNSQRPKFHTYHYTSINYATFAASHNSFRKIIRKFLIWITANFP